LLTQRLSELANVKIRIFEPNAQAGAIVQNIAAPQLTEAIASYIMLLQGYLKGMMDPVVRLLELHKLAYFQQVMGERLNLDFVKYHYGPYARNLRFVLNRLEGHYISGYGDGGDDPKKLLCLLPGAVQDAEKCLATCPSTKNRIAAVLTLVRGFESPDALELMASVHWLVVNEHCSNTESILAGLANWNDKKRRFTKMQVERVLSALREMKLGLFREIKHADKNETAENSGLSVA